MRYAKTYKQETREGLIERARVVVKDRGFASTGIDALMASVGLSGGAFYTHFASKADFLACLIEREMAQSTRMLRAPEDAGQAGLQKLVKAYLGMHHASHAGEGCALPALGAEIARSGPEVRTRVERAVKDVHGSWARHFEGDGDAAWAWLSQCVGAVLMARAVETDRTRQEILASVRRRLAKVRVRSEDVKP